MFTVVAIDQEPLAHEEANGTDIAMKRGADSIEQPQRKKTCVRCSEEADITVVVGGIVYKEYRTFLRSWSGYFDRALSSGMREASSLRFEFPERDPKEWEWIVSLMAPMPEEVITIDKLQIALDWFDFLCSDRGLKGCDRVLRRHLPDEPWSILNDDCVHNYQPMTGDQLAIVMEYLEATVKYNLPESRSLCFKVVDMALLCHEYLFEAKDLQTLTRLIREDEMCRNLFLEPLRAHLPQSITDEETKILLENNMLHTMIRLHIDSRDLNKLKQDRRFETETIRIL